MDRVLDGAGVPPGRGRDAALVELYDYHAEHNLWEYVPPDILPALERLRALGLKLAVASNANGVIHRSFERTGLTRYFDAICDSCLEGVEKPDPRFFGLVVDRAGGRRETTLHVGDLYHVDVVGARSAGLRAMLLNPDGLYAGFDVDCVRSLGRARRANVLKECRMPKSPGPMAAAEGSTFVAAEVQMAGWKQSKRRRPAEF